MQVTSSWRDSAIDQYTTSQSVAFGRRAEMFLQARMSGQIASTQLSDLFR